MSAFVIFHSTIKDPKKFQSYASAAGATLARYGGEVALKGNAIDVLQGLHPHQSVGVLRFPDLDKAARWYGSSDYQALIPVRNAAAEMTIVSYEEPDS